VLTGMAFPSCSALASSRMADRPDARNVPRSPPLLAHVLLPASLCPTACIYAVAAGSSPACTMPITFRNPLA
jgi:hypothetical protein